MESTYYTRRHNLPKILCLFWLEWKENWIGEKYKQSYFIRNIKEKICFFRLMNPEYTNYLPIYISIPGLIKLILIDKCV